MGLFSSKPKMQTITQRGGKTFEYMEFVKGYPLPDDVKILENMVAFYRKHNSSNPTKSDTRDGYIRKADYHDILIKYFQLGGKMGLETLNDMRNVSNIIVTYGTSNQYFKSDSWLNPDTLKNKALGMQLWKKMAEQYLALYCFAYPQMKLSLAVAYMNKYPDSYDFIRAVMSDVAEREMAAGRKSEYFDAKHLSTTAVLEYLEHDWPAFYEAEFGNLPEGAPETVSGILKKYNLTPAQYYEKAAKGGGGKRSMYKAVNITPACVINEMFKAAQQHSCDTGDINDVVNCFYALIANGVKDELYQNMKQDMMAQSCIHHMFADIALAAFILAELELLDSLPAFGGEIGLKENSKHNLTTYKTTASVSQYRLADAGYARMMRRHGFPEKIYKDKAMYGELTASEVYKLADRAKDLKFKTKAEKSVLFEPEL